MSDVQLEAADRWPLGTDMVNALGWYTRRWVNRRSHRALASALRADRQATLDALAAVDGGRGPLLARYNHHYRSSWMRYAKYFRASVGLAPDAPVPPFDPEGPCAVTTYTSTYRG